MNKNEAIELLKKLIATPSLSREEDKTASIIENYLKSHGIPVNRFQNNVWAVNKFFDPKKPSILLNSHHDTVKPNDAYRNDPFEPIVKQGKLFGLGSNDAGGALVSLYATFIHFYNSKNLKYNLVFAATAEEENSGKNGIVCILSNLPKIKFAIVGEPTLMQMAIAERRLLVLDCEVKGKPGHAAREEGENAIHKALKDIEWFRTYRFPKTSKYLGPVKMSVTIIKAGSQHNVVPALCEFTVDIRTTDAYSPKEVLAIIKKNVSCKVVPRFMRSSPKIISLKHPLVIAGKKAGLKTYGSPTSSDMAVMPWTSVKIGPGDSARSHMADEFIFVREIEEGVETYIKILSSIVQ